MTGQLSTGDIKRLIDDLPDFGLGVEHEYKWPLGLPASDDLDAMLGAIGPPAGYREAARVTVTQSSIYLDDPGWGLADAGVSLACVLNHGAIKRVAWLVLKETLVWHRGRRDTLEVAARIDPGQVSPALADWDLLPMRRLAGLLGRRPRLGAYASTTQLRRKADFAHQRGSLLSVSLDRSTVQAEHGPPTERGSLEIESNQSDGRGLRELDGWAGTITARLGSEPYRLTKPACAAQQLGWDPAGATAAAVAVGSAR